MLSGVSFKKFAALSGFVGIALLPVVLFAQDGDGDGLSDADEIILGTDPNVADDFDGDGIFDFFEDDADGDGVSDDFECYGSELADYTLKNPSFEIPDYASQGYTSDDYPVSSSVMLWETAGPHIELRVLEGAYDGDNHLELNSTGPHDIWQQITTEPASNLIWRFAHKKRRFSDDRLSLKMGVPPATDEADEVFLAETGFNWTVYSGVHTVPAGQTTTEVRFDPIFPTDSAGNFFDAVQVKQYCTNDSDLDGAPDWLDLDSDNDGFDDACVDTDTDGICDREDDDDDGDGVDDRDEMSCVNTVSPTSTVPPAADMSPLGPDNSTIGAPYDWLGGDLNTTVTALAGSVDARVNFVGGLGSSARVDFNPPVASLDFVMGDLDDGETKDLRAYDADGVLVPLIPHLTNKTSQVSLTGQAGQSVRVYDQGTSTGSTYTRFVRFHVDGVSISRLEADFTARDQNQGTGDLRIINACIALDADADDVGDHIDDDMDNDGFDDTDDDNCPSTNNPDQLDTDGDGTGDACDADDDGDGISDGVDNCPVIANADQADLDGDGTGDVCDGDDDGDGVADGVDNCPVIANTDQADLDGDGSGNVCDEDDDDDTVPDANDNCPLVANTDQLDADSNGIGDVCDTDDDNDGVIDGVDNCPLAANSDQADTDSDGVGDVCDDDDDGDGVVDQTDNCPLISNPDQLNSDSDTTGNACDADDDNDGIDDGADNCPLVVNPDQTDTDLDGTGDVCSDDSDGDGVTPDQADNCPTVPNADQADTDLDGVGDACDSDDDNDGVQDTVDNCPMTNNVEQLDTDGDAMGDLCDDDDDGDGILDNSDNCPLTVNVGQSDIDSDGLGDACDAIIVPVLRVSNFWALAILLSFIGALKLMSGSVFSLAPGSMNRRS